MTATPPSSLRDVYASQSNAWSFLPPPLPSGSSPENATVFTPPASQSYEWSTRTRTNPLFDLAFDPTADDSNFNVAVVAKGLLITALTQYMATAVVMPLEVGKTLLQVQWVPRDTGEVPPGAVLTTDAVDDEEEESDTSNEHDAYFADPTRPESESSVPPRIADERGYVVRQSVLEEGTIPEYVVPVGSAAGSWGMAKRLGRFHAEGWLSLWKGLLTSAVNDGLTAILQPTISDFLQSIIAPSDPSPSSYTQPLLIPVISHVLTGFLLSPLDLVRTRLIIQSSHPRYRTYTGPIDALSQILTSEGGLKGAYLHPHLLLPTLLDCTVRTLVPLTLPGVFASYLTLGGAPVLPETHPFTWAVAQLLGSCAGLLITLPIETARRRLQAQVRGTAKPIKACVELRPAPYNGVVDALWHITTEERSDLPLKTKRRRKSAGGRKGKGKGAELLEAEELPEEGESWLRNTGIGQLYRGLGVRLAASVTVFVLGLVSADPEPDAGWAEL